MTAPEILSKSPARIGRYISTMASGIRAKLTFLCLLALTGAATGASTLAPTRIDPARLDSLRGVGESRARAHGAVIVFLGTECPLSRNHALTINRLLEAYLSDSVAFLGLVPRATTGSKELTDFAREYDVRFRLVGDPDLEWARALGATVTPEAFLIDTAGTVIYAGSVDNWAISLGKRRHAATEHYLRNALDAWRGGKVPGITRTTAVGCLIE